MRRLCGRPGCSAPATVTFTFDASRRIVWLNGLSDGTARAGDLCTRHADALVPPQGWTRDDRREVVPTERATGEGAMESATGTADELLPHREPKRRKRKTQRWSDVPSLFDPPDDPGPDPIPLPVVLELVDTRQPEEPDEPDEPELIDLDASDKAHEPGEAHDLDEIDPDDVGAVPAWEPRFEVDDLGGLLDAKSPLLSRAFRAAKAPDESDPATSSASGDSVDPDEVF